MARRVTIMISNSLDKKVRLKQSMLIAKTKSNVSYSSVVNDVLNGDYKL